MRMNGFRWYGLRWKILARDGFRCQYCGQSAPNVILEVDHITAIANGGTDDPSNLIAACWACNRGKSHLRESILREAERRARKPQLTMAFRADQILGLLDPSTGITVNALVEHVFPDQPSIKQAKHKATIRTTLHRLTAKGKARKDGDSWYLST